MSYGTNIVDTYPQVGIYAGALIVTGGGSPPAGVANKIVRSIPVVFATGARSSQGGNGREPSSAGGQCDRRTPAAVTPLTARVTSCCRNVEGPRAIMWLPHRHGGGSGLARCQGKRPRPSTASNPAFPRPRTWPRQVRPSKTATMEGSPAWAARCGPRSGRDPPWATARVACGLCGLCRVFVVAVEPLGIMILKGCNAFSRASTRATCRWCNLLNLSSS